jgi:hypothetical protein
MLPSVGVRRVSLNYWNVWLSSTKSQADDLNIGDASFRERSLGESQLWEILTTVQLNIKQMISYRWCFLPGAWVSIVEMFDFHQLNIKQTISISAMLPSSELVSFTLVLVWTLSGTVLIRLHFMSLVMSICSLLIVYSQMSLPPAPLTLALAQPWRLSLATGRLPRTAHQDCWF